MDGERRSWGYGGGGARVQPTRQRREGAVGMERGAAGERERLLRESGGCTVVEGEWRLHKTVLT